MKKETNISRSIMAVALVTVLLLLIPLVAMQFTSEVNWGIGDFVIMGALLFGTGFSFVLMTRYVSDIVYRLAIGSALGATLLLIWVNLAVGLIGGGPNAGNWMYIGVIAVGIIGTALSRFTPRGFERTLFAMALSIVVIGIIALVAGMQNYPSSSVREIIGVNSFFATLFALSGLLFRYVAMVPSQRTEKTNG